MLTVFYKSSLNGVGVLLILVFLLSGCGEQGNKHDSVDKTEKDQQGPALVKRDLEAIKKDGKLKAITGYSSTSYFIYRGKPMGYEYELLQRFADYLDLELEIIVAKDIQKMFEMLNNGEGDLIAYGLTVTQPRKAQVDFSAALNRVRQKLVQKKPNKWRYMRKHELEKHLITDPSDLEGDTVHVRKNSSYAERMQNLNEEIGGGITVVEAPEEQGTEALIKRVAEGDIEYTVSDENIALVNQTHYPSIHIGTSVSFPQKLAWAVRKNAPKLLDTVNAWVHNMKKKSVYNVIYNKYFKNRKASNKRMASAYFSLTSNSLSPFDQIIKKYGKDINWDWRLLAALAYQESNFNPKAKSWAGAKGLMQVMPKTAKQYGIYNLYDPDLSVKAGTKQIEWLKNYWKQKIKDSTERVKFILASYNAGHGHVADARRLAEKFEGDPHQWAVVGEYLRKKSDRQYYTDPVVKYGYCRGEEPYHYVREIMNRYEHYKRFIDRSGKETSKQAYSHKANQSYRLIAQH